MSLTVGGGANNYPVSTYGAGLFLRLGVACYLPVKFSPYATVTPVQVCWVEWGWEDGRGERRGGGGARKCTN
jgi:hypothetical protein